VTQVIHDLFPVFLHDPSLLPERWHRDVAQANGDETQLARMVCDYVSGMTDRFAFQAHARLIG
ncbi:MAG: deoxyguanosinetriphosphate triphosphohydrolase, partial [Pseudomonadota bacterium]